MADPDYPNKVYAVKTEDIRMCFGCLNRILVEGKLFSCAINPSTRVELADSIHPDIGDHKIAVIGGSVAGAHSFKKEVLRLDLCLSFVYCKKSCRVSHGCEDPIVWYISRIEGRKEDEEKHG